MRIGISKSRYTLFQQCPKALWLKMYKPELCLISDALQQRFQSGSIVGDLARGLFGKFTDVTSYYEDGKLDLTQMVANTRKCIESETEVICEAAFQYAGTYCAVDILKKDNSGYAIYEVKSSTDGDKEVYGQDVAFQKYILTHCGIEVTGTYLISINSDYVLDGELDIHRLFQMQDISVAVEREYLFVEHQVAKANQMLTQKDVEPNEDLDVHCHKPYDCAFLQYCSRNLPERSVFNLYRMNFEKKIAYYQQNKITYEQLQSEALNEKQQMQIHCALNDTIYINKVEIANFLSTIT